jgi:membrane protease YdiL (CAAX protease family)
MSRSVAVPIVAFLVVSAIASPALAELQGVTGLNPDVLRLTVFSTAVGAAAVWLLWRKRLAYPPTTTFGLGGPILVSIAACLVAGVIVLCLAKVEGAPWRPPGPGALGAPLAVVLAVQLLGAAAEEVGWRGLVQPLLETRLAPWKAALVTGALFGLGHFYLAFAVSAVAFLLFLVGAVALSLILALATVGRSWKSRIAIATLLHFLVNMETFFLFADGDGSVLYFADLAVAFGAGGMVALGFLLRRQAARSA